MQDKIASAFVLMSQSKFRTQHSPRWKMQSQNLLVHSRVCRSWTTGTTGTPTLENKTENALRIVSLWLLCPRGLTFTWWGCYGLCLWHKPAELAHSFLFCSCVHFCLYGPFNCISFHKFSWQISAFSLMFFQSYLCPIGPFNNISLYESLPQPWHNPKWLTGLKQKN